MEREIYSYGVRGRNTLNRKWHTTSADFNLEFQRFCRPDDVHLGQSAPYACDFRAERLLTVGYDDPSSVMGATFLYTHQLRSAETVFSVPYELLPAVSTSAWGADNGVCPILLFSTGRCGSTLLANLCSAISLPSISEPDVYTEFATLPGRKHMLPELANVPAVLACATHGLMNITGENCVVIKPRGQVNRISHLLMTALPGARGLMLVREPEPWALSMSRAFGWSVAVIVQSLTEAHIAVDRCNNAGRPLQVLHYEDICADPLRFISQLASLVGLPAGSVDQAVVSAVIASDSQAGTALARNNLVDRQVPSNFLPDFHSLWNIRKRQLLEKGIELLV